MKCPSILKTTEITLNRCNNTSCSGIVYFSGKKQEKSPDHPYFTERVQFRGNSTSFDVSIGDFITAFEETWRVERKFISECRNRVIIGAIRLEFLCPTTGDLYCQETINGCDAHEEATLIGEDIELSIAQDFSAENVVENRKQWTSRYNIYIPQVWGSQLSWDSWFLINGSWYDVIELRDMDRITRLPYGIAEKRCPPWDLE